VLGVQVVHCRPGGCGGQGSCRTGEPVSGDLVSAGSDVQRASGLERPARRLVGPGEQPSASAAGLPAGRPVGDRPDGDDRATAGGSLGRDLAAESAAAARPLRLGRRQYSVHPAAVGRRVEVTADLDTVRIIGPGQRCRNRERCWASHQTLADPPHARAAAALRDAHRTAARTRLRSRPAP